MSEDAFAALVALIVFIGPIVLGGAVWGIYAMVQDILEKRHQRKIEMIRTETKLHEQINKQWNDQFKELGEK